MNVDVWIHRAKGGDAEAFNRLVDVFSGVAYGVALHHTGGNADEAADACQEAMLSAWKAVERFEGDARAFRSWLLRIVINACRDRRRYERRRPSDPIETERDGELQSLPLPDPGMSPEAYAMNADLGALLAAALAALSVEHREVILLDQAGLDYAEMAETLGVEVGTVKSRLSRARGRMRQILTGAGAGPAEPSVDGRRPGSVDTHANMPPASGSPGESRR